MLGLVGALLICSQDRLRHLLIALSIISSIGLYLSYRDLHAAGLWQYSNYHYLKWSFGLCGYCMLLLVRLAVDARRRQLFWVLPVGAALFG